MSSPQLEALEGFLEVWDEHTVFDIGPHLTCSEANALAEFFEAVGHDEMAEALIKGHALEDDEGDEHYTEEDE